MASYDPKSLFVPILIVVALVAAIGLAVYFSTGEEETATVSDKLVYDAALAEPINDQDWAMGQTDKPRVTLVVYSDFQCPACAYSHQNIVEEIVKKHPDDVRVIFRHFPISSHKKSKLAAQATEAAGNQGKFWEMAAQIFADQSELSRDKLIEIAGQLDLDTDKFTSDLDSEKYLDEVEADYDSGQRSGVDATPTFYINGEKYEGKIKPSDVIGEIEKKLP